MDDLKNFEYEEELNIKQLLFFIFRKWRSILAAAVVLGILFGGVKTAKGVLDLQDPEKVEESLKESELALQNYETAKTQLTNQMAEYNRQLDDYQKYAENSLYMKIDPYAVYQESVTYVVTTDYQILPNMTYQTLNWMGPVLSAYTSVAESVTLKDLSPEGRSGLSEEWDADSLDKMIKVETNVNDGKLTITASAESEVRAKAILQAVKEKVANSQDSIAKAAGEHKLSVISEKSSITVDQTMINERELRLRNITALREAADKASEKFKLLNEPSVAYLSEGNVIKGGIKYSILGFIIGAFLCCFVYTGQYILNGRLNDIYSLKDRYQTRILAVLPGTQKANCIDRFLNDLEGSKADHQTDEALLKVAGANLGGVCNGRSVAVTGTASDDIRSKITKLLEQADDLTLYDVGNILIDADAVRKVRSADFVIMVETKNESVMSDIEREVELLSSMGKRLEGFIIV